MEEMDSESSDYLEVGMECETEILIGNVNAVKALAVAVSEEDYRLGRIKFSTLFELKETGKKEVLEWCMDAGLIAPSYMCPQCEKFMTLVENSCSDGYMWFCCEDGEKEHSIMRSVRNGSVFSGSKLEIIDILIIIHCWIYKVPYEWIYVEFDFSEKTLAEWGDYCRDICLEICAKELRKIGGDGKVVEIIGGKFETRKPREDDVKESCVFVGIENMYADISFVRFVEKCDKKCFLEVIEKSVLPGTTILSKFSSDFNWLEDEDFDSLATSYSYTFEDPETFAEEQVSKQRKSFWSTIKKQLPRHSVKKGTFDNYYAEFIWRKKHSCAYDKMRKFILAMKTVFPPIGTDSMGPEWFEKPCH